MTTLKLHTPDFTEANIAKLAELFPHCVTESTDANGDPKRVIDFDLLKQELSSSIVEGTQERYQLNWVGKKEALLTANAPIAKTLRPCKKESVDFDSTQNLYIEGDNLDALKLLQETYLNQVKMIYIDPPYNTGNDFIYRDKLYAEKGKFDLDSGFKDEDGNRLIDQENWKQNSESNGRFHSDWLSMMYSRLRLARNLLRDDGVIFISIDDNEQANIKRLCDEIFGEDNFVANVVWQKRTSPDARCNLSAAHDYVLVFSKDATYQNSLNKLPITEERKSQYTNSDNDPRGAWASVDLTGQTGHATSSQFYKIQTPSGEKYLPPEGRCWAIAEDTFNKLNEDGRIWFGLKKDSRPRLKKYLSETDGMNCWTWWTNTDVGHNQEATKEVKAFLGAGDIFDNPKPTKLLKRILALASNSSDIILDFFSGSATTAHAVMQLNAEDGGNRKFIMVQLPEVCDEKSEAHKAGFANIAEIGKERIRRAGQKIKTEATPDLDIGFRVLKIDSSNMNEVYYSPDQTNQQDLLNLVDNIRADRSDEDLLFQVLLDWGVDLTLPITQETIAEKTVFTVANNQIVACFDRQGGITEGFIKELATRQPLRVVFCDSGFSNDSVKINIAQVFKSLSPQTELKTI